MIAVVAPGCNAKLQVYSDAATNKTAVLQAAFSIPQTTIYRIRY